jgi:hypothetical protein
MKAVKKRTKVKAKAGAKVKASAKAPYPMTPAQAVKMGYKKIRWKKPQVAAAAMAVGASAGPCSIGIGSNGTRVVCWKDTNGQCSLCYTQ